MSVAREFHEFVHNVENLDFTNPAKVKERVFRILQQLTELFKDDKYRESMEVYLYPDMLILLARISHLLYARLLDEKKISDKTLALVEICSESFRTLRNSCAGCKRNQQEVLKNPGLYRVAGRILHVLVAPPKFNYTSVPEVLQCLKIGVQFLGNAAAGFDESKSLVWESVFNTARPLLKAEDATLANYTAMLIYTCLTLTNMSDLVTTPDGLDIVTAITNHLHVSKWSKHDAEWALHIIGKLLTHNLFLEKSYKKLEDMEKSMLLNFILTKLRVMEEKSEGSNHSKDNAVEMKVSPGNIAFISTQFKAKSSVLLNLRSYKDLENTEPMMVTRILEVLGTATSTNHYKEVREDKALTKCAVNLLKQMNSIGKQGDNAFTAKTKLSDTGSMKKDHPAYGLKKDIVKLIANLTYKNKGNQDEVRELGGIPLILDSTNIDSRNPFITQWAVFAMRNICDANPENQAVLNGLKLEGISDKASLLQDLGVEASVEGDKVIVKSLKSVAGDRSPRGPALKR